MSTLSLKHHPLYICFLIFKASVNITCHDPLSTSTFLTSRSPGQSARRGEDSCVPESG